MVNDEQLFENLKEIIGVPPVYAESQPIVLEQDSCSADPISIDGYTFVREIYRGGQGIVFQAIQIATKRSVAIKLLVDGRYATDEKRIRFEREIDLVAQLKHPNIVTIYDSGLSRGQAFYSMEYVAGATLDKHVRSLDGSSFVAGATDKAFIRNILRIFLKIGNAVSHAHRHGVIHRDLKPGNIIVDEDGEPKILDFGLAKIDDWSGQDHHPTVTGEYLGTPAYSSPEQVLGKTDSIDTRSDVYSLGVILFELLTQRFPYSVTGSFVEVANEIRDTLPNSPAALNRIIDNELETIVLKALAKKPQSRYQTVDQLVDDIESYLAGRPIEAKRDSSWYVLRKSIRRYWPALSVVAIVLIALTCSLFVSMGFHRQAVRDRNLAEQANQKTGAALQQVSTQKAAAEKQSYIAGLAAAAGSIQLHDVAETNKRIQRVPTSLRGWEWYHFLHLLDDSETSIRVFDRKATFACLSGDQKQLLAAGQDNSIRLIEFGTHSELLRIDRESYGPVQASPDFEWTAYSADDGSVQVIKTQTFEKIHRFFGMGQSPTCIRFSDDGQKLAAGFAKGKDSQGRVGVAIWDLTTGEKIREFPFQFWHINDLRFSPDQKRLAAITFEGGSVWDIPTGRRLQKLPDRPGMENCIAFDNTGTKIFTGGADGLIHCFDLTTNRESFQLQGHRGAITDFEVCDGGQKLVSVSRDKTVRVWDLTEQKSIKVLKGHTWAIESLKLINGGKKLITASWDQTIRVWEGIHAPRSNYVAAAHADQVIALAFSPNGRLFATSSNDQTIKIWSTGDRQLVQTLEGHSAPVHGVTFSHDGKKLASVGWNGEAMLWSTVSWKKLGDLRGHQPQARVHSVVFSQDDQWLISGTSNNELIVWDTVSMMPIRRLEGHDDHIHAVNLSADNRFIVSAGHRSIKVWKTDDFSLLRSIDRKMLQDDFSLAVHPQQNWVAAGADVGVIKLWDIESGQVIQTYEGHSDEINAVEFFPDGSRMISTSFDNSVKIWETESGKELLNLFGYEGHANSIGFTLDGYYAIAGLESGDLKFWPGITAKELKRKADELLDAVKPSGSN